MIQILCIFILLFYNEMILVPIRCCVCVAVRLFTCHLPYKVVDGHADYFELDVMSYDRRRVSAHPMSPGFASVVAAFRCS